MTRYRVWLLTGKVLTSVPWCLIALLQIKKKLLIAAFKVVDSIFVLQLQFFLICAVGLKVFDPSPGVVRCLNSFSGRRKVRYNSGSKIKSHESGDPKIFSREFLEKKTKLISRDIDFLCYVNVNH